MLRVGTSRNPLCKRGSSLTTPTKLFMAGEKGVHFDASDFSTMFQDSAGTTPVTSVEQPVGLWRDKSGNGFHASQATSTKRPTLSARANFLTYSEDLSNAAWLKSFAGTGTVPVVSSGFTAPDGTSTAWRVQLNKGAGTAIGDYSFITPNSDVAVNPVQTYYVWVKSNTAQTYQVLFSNTSLTAVSPTWTQVAVSSVANGRIMLRGTYGTSDSADVLVWHPQLSPAGMAYQRIGAATDYDTAGFPHYLKFDGVDDALQTPSINFTATDKMTVFAGVRKLSDAAYAAACEHGVPGTDAKAIVALAAPRGATPSFAMSVRDGLGGLADVQTTQYAAPVTAVVSGGLDISTTGAANQVKIRVNTAPITNSILTNTCTAAVFGNYPLYIGARAGNSSFFTGNLYQLIIRGTASTSIEIAAIEQYLNLKTLAY